MTFFALLLAVGNIFLAGMHWGIILSNRNEGNAVPGRLYTFSFMHLITGCYLLLAAVGSAA
jgi:hypothetical protein